MLCNITCIMLYNMCHVVLYNMSHVLCLYNMCHVMLYNMPHVILNDICHRLCCITCGKLCYVIENVSR